MKPARAGLIAPDETTYAYIKGRPRAPKGADWERAVAYWRTLASDAGAVYDKEVTLAANDIEPQVTWGTSPEDVVSVTGRVPDPEDFENPGKRRAVERTPQYMDLRAGTPITDIKVDRIFVGSCTNARIEDLRAAAAVLKGRKIAPHVQAWVVPGSGLVKKTSGGRGTGPSVPRRRFRMARAQLFDVQRHQRR